MFNFPEQSVFTALIPALPRFATGWIQRFNDAMQGLVNRTKYLKDELDNKVDIADYNPLFKGIHTSDVSLNIAFPTAPAGSYALVDAGEGEDAIFYWFDGDDGWITNGDSVSLSSTDALVEGDFNKYFTNVRVKEAFIREDVTFAAAALASNATTTNTVNIASRYQLLHITTSHPCRVCLYTSTAKRDADLTRPMGTDPTGNHGLLFEFISTTELLSADLSPLVDGFADTAAIPYSLTNLSGAIQTISVTLNHVKTGA